MKELGEQLTPGSAAVIALVRRVTMDKVLEGIQIPGRVIQTSLDNEAEERLAEALAAAGQRRRLRIERLGATPREDARGVAPIAPSG